MLKKILLIPYFGQYPEWMDRWVANMEYLKEYGYDYKIYSNLSLFEERVRQALGIEPSVEYGSGKPWDYRPALAVLFARDVEGYDYWGHTDFDCVYGDVGKFIPDDELEEYDIWTNEDRYICGPWSLYRNCKLVNNAFRLNSEWREKLEDPVPNAWLEKEYTQTVNRHLGVKYDLQQAQDWDNFDTLSFIDGKLYEGENEIMLAHFRRKKEWPIHTE